MLFHGWGRDRERQNSLSQNLTVLTAPSRREPLAWRQSFSLHLILQKRADGVRPLSQALSGLPALPKGEPRALPGTLSLLLKLQQRALALGSPFGRAGAGAPERAYFPHGVQFRQSVPQKSCRTKCCAAARVNLLFYFSKYPPSCGLCRNSARRGYQGLRRGDWAARAAGALGCGQR